MVCCRFSILKLERQLNTRCEIISLIEREKKLTKNEKVLERDTAKQYTCILFNTAHLLLISSQTILQYQMNSFEQSPKRIKLGGEGKPTFVVKQSLSHWMTDTWILISGAFEFQVIDVSISGPDGTSFQHWNILQAKSNHTSSPAIVLFFKPPDKSQSSFFMTGSSSRTVVTATSERYSIYGFPIGISLSSSLPITHWKRMGR